jgi:Transposase DDE domain
MHGLLMIKLFRLKNNKVITMHVEVFIHNFLSSVIHKSRIKVLVCVLNALIKTKRLSLTSLGRAIDLPIQERSGIRKIDRFLSNKFFQNNNICIYQKIIDVVIGAKTRPLIVIDWTKLPNSNSHALRAGLAAEGRAVTIYEEVHPKKLENNAKVQRSFLKKLKQLLPSSCRPIVITDAGFRGPWFRDILKLNWDYVGRVLHSITCYSDGKIFRECGSLYKLATTSPKYLGDMILNKHNGIKTSFYLIKQKTKGRKHYLKNGGVSTKKDSRDYAKVNSNPWLLVSSLKGTFTAKKVIEIYKRRMTIEESFRDMKSSQYGFGLRKNKTIRVERFSVWLLLSSLASFIAWIVGCIAEKSKLHYQFQANTTKAKRVLSLFYLGCQVIKRGIKIPIDFNKWNFDLREFA